MPLSFAAILGAIRGHLAREPLKPGDTLVVVVALIAAATAG